MKADVTELQVRSESDIGARLAQLKLRISGRLELGLQARFMRYGLSRDLDLPLEKPSAKIPIAIRPMIADDVPLLLPLDGGDEHHEKLEIAWRRAFVDKRPHGCFVAVDLRSDTPCYMQWLFGARDNEFIRQQMRGFPMLEPHEALLENAYTPPKHRGLGIMSAAMALIAERAAAFGARQVLTFVDEHNIASLKGCQRAGFYPHILHHRVQRFFGLLRTDEFEKLADTDPRRKLRF